MKVSLISHTPNPERVVAAAAKMCYAAGTVDTVLDGLTEENVANFVDMLASLGHESPMEHASYTFAIEGVSRALLAQITRHRIASYSVQSQRYVSEDGFEYITPPEIAEDAAAKQLFEESMKRAREDYLALTKMLFKRHFEEFLRSFDEKTAKSKAQKKAIEDARFVLSNACDTKMVATFNARSLHNFFNLRCCNRAQWEILALADEMLRLVKEVSPVLFKNAGPPCLRGKCPEGKMTCGQAAEVKEKYLS